MELIILLMNIMELKACMNNIEDGSCTGAVGNLFFIAPNVPSIAVVATT
jgi:hypothetical protein